MSTVMISGASRGIGKATALKFANLGYNVVVCYNDSKQQAEDLVNEIKKNIKCYSRQGRRIRLLASRRRIPKRKKILRQYRRGSV